VGDVHGSSPRGVFLSYRREDAAPYARLLQSELRERFPDTVVFMDLDSIEPGRSFAEVIREAVDSCAVMVALIGRQWATLTDEEGHRRLDDPDDIVRFEVQTALERGVRVIPVLIDGASPLRHEQLPAELRKLARLNALELSYGQYQSDADRLINLIEPRLTGTSETDIVDQPRDVSGSSLQGVFLSYWRQDAGPYARLLRSELRERFPDMRVFMDLDSIEAGLDFAEVIREAVDSCAVMVALIGRQWATLTDEEGHRRLDDPDDFVRFEVQTALERGVRVIPVLIDGAKPLRQEQLPAELHKLARLNALELNYDRYDYDVDRLIDLIQRMLDAASSAASVNESPSATNATPNLGEHITEVETKVTLPHLNGRQFQLVHHTIVSSYDHESLARDLEFELNKRLLDISDPDSFSNVVFRVLKAAEWQGWLLDLLRMLQDFGTPHTREAAERMLVELGPPLRRGLKEKSPAIPRPVKVFLCHSSSDKTSVRALRSRLINDGIQPWFDEEDILPGEKWEFAIKKAIRTSDMVLVCLSVASISKIGYLQKEIRSVLDVADEQPEGTTFLIPVRLEPCDVPERLNRWQWVDLFDENGYPRLIRSLRSRNLD
jgi:hypothetical protein